VSQNKDDASLSTQWALKDPSVSILFVQAALSGAKKAGFDCNKILSDAKIEANLLKEPQARISPDQYTRLIQTLWLTMKDEFMGLANNKCPLGSFSMMCLSIIHCETLYQAIKRGARFGKLSLGELDLNLEVNDESAILSIHFKEPLVDPTHFLSECLLVILHRLFCWMIGKQIIIDKALFNYSQPSHAREYHGLFCRQLSFNQKLTGLQFNRRYLDMAVLQDERSLKEYLKMAPANIITKPKYDDSYTAKIRTLINQGENSDFPTFETIAAQLHTTPSTLRRNLKKENSSYQEIKDAIRRDISIYFLTETNLPLQKIAEKLGYTEASTFQHTFKKWTGIAPGAYRGKLNENK
jgi:AraC-like DNA-binding protein